MKEKPEHKLNLGGTTSSWGTATVSVVLGQLYVGTGYRVLHEDMTELLRKVDGVLLHKSDSPYRGIL